MISSISSSNSLYQSLMTQMRQQMYNSMDTDGNGSVSKTEFTNLASGSSTTSDVDALFSQIDTDGDGSITSGEFDSAMNTMGYPPPPFGDVSSADLSQQLFSTYDTDADGQLSSDELSEMTAAGPEGGPSADELIANLDTDGNGTLSEAEFAAGAPQGGNPPPPASEGVSSSMSSEEVFDALDTNEDGFVSQAEWAAGSTSASSETGSSTNDLFATLLENLQSASTDNDASSTSSTTSRVEELLAAIQSYMKFDTTSYSLADNTSLFGSDLYA